MLTLMIVLASAICVEGSSRSCAIDKVLVSVPANSEQKREFNSGKDFEKCGVAKHQRGNKHV